MKKDELFISHILDCIAAIESFVKGVTEEDFMQNRLLQSAVIREIEVIGEASKNISDEFKVKHKSVPWRAIAGTRDKIIHHYFGIDLTIVWRIVKSELPELK